MCVFSGLMLTGVTIQRDAPLERPQLSLQPMFIFTPKTHLRGNCVTGSMKHEEVYRDIWL